MSSRCPAKRRRCRVACSNAVQNEQLYVQNLAGKEATQKQGLSSNCIRTRKHDRHDHQCDQQYLNKHNKLNESLINISVGGQQPGFQTLVEDVIFHCEVHIKPALTMFEFDDGDAG